MRSPVMLAALAATLALGACGAPGGNTGAVPVMPAAAAPSPLAGGSSAPATAASPTPAPGGAATSTNALTGMWSAAGPDAGGNTAVQGGNLPNIALTNFAGSASVIFYSSNTGIITISDNTCPATWNFQEQNVDLPRAGNLTNSITFTTDRTNLNCAFTLTDGRSGETVRVQYTNR